MERIDLAPIGSDVIGLDSIGLSPIGLEQIWFCGRSHLLRASIKTCREIVSIQESTRPLGEASVQG